MPIIRIVDLGYLPNRQEPVKTSVWDDSDSCLTPSWVTQKQGSNQGGPWKGALYISGRFESFLEPCRSLLEVQESILAIIT